MNMVQIKAAWAGPPQCQHCDMRHLVLFSSLEEHEFGLIHGPIDEHRYAKGEVIYRTEEPGRHLFTIREGSVKLVHYSAEGGERIVRLCRRGDVLGLEALLGQSYQHHAITLEPVFTCCIPVSVVTDLSQRSPKFFNALMTRWQQAVSASDSWLTELGTGPVKSRVARFLIRLAEGEGDKACFMPTREDIGAMLAVTTESVSRITANFQRDGLIEYLGPHSVRVDIAGLMKLLET